MYRNTDYLRRGLRFLNNHIFPSHKKLSSLMFYGTNLCDSRCRHCLIWNKKPKISLSKDTIVSIMQSRCITPHTTVGLEGGEFLLHPEADAILSWFSRNHPNFDILSNCLKPDKLIDAVTQHTPHRLYLSLDGTRDTYRDMRGVDGYDKVMRVIEACRNTVPISLMFTLTPYNTVDDLEHVINTAEHYGIDVRAGIYNNISFFDTSTPAHSPATMQKRHNLSKVLPRIMQTPENADFLLLYSEWLQGNVQLKCLSISDSLVIHPDGNVPVCQNLDVMLGNVHEQSLDDIFNSRNTVRLHRHYRNRCNRCWINFHRKYDVVFYRSLEKILPKRAVQLLCGNYRWTADSTCPYKKFMQLKCHT